MAALPYIQLYTADYLADTAHLTTLENGAYLLLMFNYWQRGESFKAKDEQTLNKRLASVARLTINEWLEVSEQLKEFFVIIQHNDCIEWKHNRIEHDLDAVREKSIKASNAGKRSAKARSANTNNERSTDVKQTLNHTDTDTDTDIKKNNTKKTKSNNKKFNPLLAKPENVSVETWSMWVKYRSEIKKPLTETMCKQQAVDLVNCPNPDDVIKKSIACGWQGLFPNPKNNIRQFPDRKPSMQANVSNFNFEVGPNGEVKF
ncbi:YdaU family protein [Entomomonas moraniae]|uniref:YdaU family protein n=1 Tax=Entomomonas moraniae TaxID=2213226 RepID=UPI001E33D441|nr:DUF1376 domain-containing protein [Entomomonas moraniae]